MSTFAIEPPTTIARQLGRRVQELRVREGWSQAELAHRSGVALGTLRRFEQAGAISLARLLKISAVLRHQDDFDRLFAAPPFRSIAEMQQAERLKARAPKRGRTLTA